MARRVRSRLTYANVVATLALFGVIAGGTAIALPGKHSVTANDLHKNAVRTAAIAKGAVTSPKIKDGTVGAAALADGGITGAKVADLSLGYEDLGSNSVVARIHANGPTSTGDGGSGNPVTMPVSTNTWTQAANEVDVFFAQIKFVQPPSCGNNGSGMVEFNINGQQFDSDFFGYGNPGNVTQPLFTSRPWLFEPGSSTPRTATIRISDSCSVAGENFIVQDIQINAVAIR